jgi:hypothetical protein
MQAMLRELPHAAQAAYIKQSFQHKLTVNKLLRGQS